MKIDDMKGSGGSPHFEVGGREGSWSGELGGQNFFLKNTQKNKTLTCLQRSRGPAAAPLHASAPAGTPTPPLRRPREAQGMAQDPDRRAQKGPLEPR